MAGIAAAIAAARGGAKTLLIEKAGWLGGMGITGATGLHSFFNIFGQYPGSERLRVVAGIAQELVDRVQVMGGGVGHVLMERGLSFLSMITPVEPETFKLAAIQLCQEAGVKLLFHTVIDEVQASQWAYRRPGRVEQIGTQSDPRPSVYRLLRRRRPGSIRRRAILAVQARRSGRIFSRLYLSAVQH